MKTPFRLSIVLWFCLSGAANLGCVASVQANELQTNSVTQQVLQAQSFREGLVWIGPKEPSASESQELLGIIRNLSQPEWTGEVEQFLEAHPHSPWAASLHCDYASFCRRTGRTTKALEHFEAAWTLIKNNTSPQAQRLGGAILANWTDLLASLGRSQKLKELIAEGDRWHFVNPQDRNKHEGTKNSYYLMQAHPEIAYRCGTFALKAVAGVLQPTNQDLESLVAVPSPTNGFSMANLLDLSKKYGLDLVAVRRTAGQELIVPSVVHWRQNHYAAILAQQEDLYLVSDPTFGREKWMPSDVINEEASGEFLIPKERLPDGWVLLARAGTLAIHGMGLPNNVNDGKDKFCKRNFDGGAACIPCKNAKGMPVWWVSEPYINLWIADQPLSYLTSRGEPFTFQITYKQRDSQSGWENSWVSTATMTGLTPCGGQSCASLYGNSDITIHLPNGGEVDFLHKSGIWNDMTPRYDSETRLMVQPLLTNFVSETRMDDGSFGLRLMHADGSQDIYLIDYATGLAGDYPQSSGKLVRHIDRNGDTTWFQYDSYGGPDVLTFVVDPDGRTNFLSYNTSSGLLLSVTNAYGQSAHFKYDSSGNLTNIVDAAGLPSSIRYDPNNTPTKLITPYGTNQFLIVDNGSAGTTSGLGNFGGHNVIDRAVQVTDPVGATNLYLYRYDCSSDTPLNMPTSFSSSDVPVGTPIGALDDGSGSTTNALAAVCYRNSFHWGPRQFANLSTANMSNLTSGDYLLARMRHWLEDTNQLFLTGYLSVERDPSPDGTTEGLKTFYDYQGKLPGFNFCAGTNALPSVRTWRLPNGETHYEYLEFDYFGNITSDITTYTESDGTVGTRTNQFIYADNTYAYLWGQTDGNGNWSGQPLTTTYTIPNLLTEVIGADGNPMWTLGGFETVMWTNFFYLAGAGETNRSVLTSCRVLPDYATNGVGEVTTIAYTPNTKPVNYYVLPTS